MPLLNVAVTITDAGTYEATGYYRRRFMTVVVAYLATGYFRRRLVSVTVYYRHRYHSSYHCRYRLLLAPFYFRYRLLPLPLPLPLQAPMMLQVITVAVYDRCRYCCL